MSAKQTKPDAKRRAKPATTTLPTISAKQVYRPQSRRILIVCFIILAAVVLGTIANNTTGFWYERQSFPGAQAPAVTNGRTALEARVTNAFLTRLQTLPGGGTITPVFQQRTDMCIKGQHDSGPGGHVDPWAYNCQLFYEGSFSYTASSCDVVHRLLAANISVSYREIIIGQDCADTPMRTMDGRTWYSSSDSRITGWDASVDTPNDFLSGLTRSGSPSNSSSTCDGGSSTVVYCQVKNIIKPASNTANYGIPTNAQAVVSYYIYDTYYQK